MFRSFDENDFKNDLASIDWDSVFSLEDYGIYVRR